MYTTLLFLHNTIRWFVIAGLLLSLYRAYSGYRSHRPFTNVDDSIRHWTATIIHIQFVIGFTLYFISPLIKFFWSGTSANFDTKEISFFALIHITMMFIAVVVVTLGSVLTKRKTADPQKFKTMMMWYGLALVIIFIAIPWPFSPFAQRPYIRPF